MYVFCLAFFVFFSSSVCLFRISPHGINQHTAKEEATETAELIADCMIEEEALLINDQVATRGVARMVKRSGGSPDSCEIGRAHV